MKHSTKRAMGTSIVLTVAAGLVGAAAWPSMATTASATRQHGGRDGAVVVTDKGAVRGVVKDDRREFQGIPYAAPPVGKLRWASPQPAKAWNGTRDATKPGNSCAQNESVMGEKESLSEDCLYLNVTAPTNPAHKKLPVMVWIHGAGFRNGSGALYRPNQLAVKGDVIVVTINYRLGLFGFLDHPALDGGAAKHRSGNFGLEDQQAALRWVKQNAGAFGGDSGNMTVFGESAGGVSTCSQLTSPYAAGLFQRAIIQSGPCTVMNWPDFDGTPSPTWLPRPRKMAEEQGRSVAAKLGCTDTDQAKVESCLRALDTKALLKESDFGFAPVYGGGGVLPVSPAEALRKGTFNKVPVMQGMTRDEFRLFQAAFEIYGVPPLTTQEEYTKLVNKYVGEKNAPKVLAQYPASKYGGSYSIAWSALVTDATFARSVTNSAHGLSGRVPTYAYEFADRSAPWVSAAKQPSFPTGAFHAAELQYQFDTDYFTGRTLSPVQQRLADQMTRYWTTFARTGDPNGAGSPRWQQGGDTAQVLAPGKGGIHATDFARDHGYAFWKSIDA
ncbi:carboxylesterase family protein [Actinomadura barringtoniae]|uniref:Carboxylic ester hydrolase n=1 Tax=Actinomadura barringtoniae TaxID=1427535 RepID=A0A939T354_9ACTN|nr:carboxylesterase/lipase family protein [Actinomadura barringtoniae]MBO2446169.1 carboxylesterase family protein [Actinomadura barringtoniae]